MLTSPHSGTATGPCHRPGVLRQGAVILLVATALSLFFGAQNYFSAASIHREVSWGQALYWSFTDWYEWALLAPIIFWTCRNFRFERRSWPKGLIIYLSVGLLLSGVHAVLCAGADVLQGWVTAQPIAFRKSLRGVLANRTHYNLAVFAVMVCAWHAWSYYREFREREMQATELAGRLAQAQLQALRMQLNPHFLFNALNAVSSLMLKDVVAANKMISRLGELLRLTLEKSDQQEVPLQQEIDFLRRYLEIEQIRFGERLQLQMEVEPSTLPAAVPNLILQPLVEKATASKCAGGGSTWQNARTDWPEQYAGAAAQTLWRKPAIRSDGQRPGRSHRESLHPVQGRFDSGRLSMNHYTRSAPGPRAQRVTRTGAMERFGPSAVGEALRAGTARAPVHGANSRPDFGGVPFP